MAVERAGLMGYMDFRQAYSALELPKLIERGTQFGLIYVDGFPFIRGCVRGRIFCD
jgi:hypothetical protein